MTEPLTRRRLLARLGLGAAGAYVAPVMVHLDAARASGVSGRSASRPSRGGAVSRASRPSRPGGGRSQDDAMRRRLRAAEAEAQRLRRLLGL